MYEDIVDEYRKQRLIRKGLRRYKTQSRYVIRNKKNRRTEQIWDILDTHTNKFVIPADEAWEFEQNGNRGVLIRALNTEFKQYNETIMTYLNLQHG